MSNTASGQSPGGNSLSSLDLSLARPARSIANQIYGRVISTAPEPRSFTEEPTGGGTAPFPLGGIDARQAAAYALLELSGTIPTPTSSDTSTRLSDGRAPPATGPNTGNLDAHLSATSLHDAGGGDSDIADGEEIPVNSADIQADRRRSCAPSPSPRLRTLGLQEATPSTRRAARTMSTSPTPVMSPGSMTVWRGSDGEMAVRSSCSPVFRAHCDLEPIPLRRGPIQSYFRRGPDARKTTGKESVADTREQWIPPPGSKRPMVSASPSHPAEGPEDDNFLDAFERPEHGTRIDPSLGNPRQNKRYPGEALAASKMPGELSGNNGTTGGGGAVLQHVPNYLL